MIESIETLVYTFLLVSTLAIIFLRSFFANNPKFQLKK